MEYDREIRANAFGLELTAMSDVWNVDDPPSEAEIELSKAISAKRIADLLERIAVSQEALAGEMAHPEWGIAPSIREATRNR